MPGLPGSTVSGSTNLDEIAISIQSSVGGGYPEPAVLLAVLLVIVGLGFKIAAVPFHSGHRTPTMARWMSVTAFMSVGPKAAGFAAIIRILVQGLGPLQDDHPI